MKPCNNYRITLVSFDVGEEITSGIQNFEAKWGDGVDLGFKNETTIYFAVRKERLEEAVQDWEALLSPEDKQKLLPVDRWMTGCRVYGLCCQLCERCG